MAKKEPDQVELLPDAWERFERAAKIVAKTPPQPRKAKKPAKKRTRGNAK